MRVSRLLQSLTKLSSEASPSWQVCSHSKNNNCKKSLKKHGILTNVINLGPHPVTLHVTPLPFRPVGMTGTAATEVSEFDSIYKLPVAVVPTNRPANVRPGLHQL